jgi:4'-phosphopantetheinyl transferase
MKVYWLEQSAADVPNDPAWLTISELTHLRTLRFAKRRADWLLGRWTAKNAVAAYLGSSSEPTTLTDIEIRQRPSGAPQVLLKGQRMSVSISLSHREGLGACAVAPALVCLGCDLEIGERHSEAFLTDYFTLEEQSMVGGANPADRIWLVSLLWSAKESALKALGEGLRLDTRDLTVTFPERAQANRQDDPQTVGSITADSSCSSFWNPIQVHRTNTQTFGGWWNRTGTRLRTVVAIPVPAPPTFLLHTPQLEVV